MAPYLLAQVEVDHADGLLGVVILVVLQHVWVAGQTATAKNKPPLLPCLRGERRKRAKGYMCALTMTAPFPADRRPAREALFSQFRQCVRAEPSVSERIPRQLRCPC